MASATPTCGICDQDNVNKPSVVWCSECDEGLCDDCKRHHSKSKSSKHHSTIPITEYQSLPEEILQIREYCQEHNEKLQMFCKQHDCPCCRLCAVDRHNKCESVTAIERVIENVKTSDSFLETENLVTELISTIERLRTNRRTNLLSIQQQRKDVESDILEARTKINIHLDHIQAILMNELADVETKVTQETNELLTSLKVEEKQLHEYQANIASIKQYATDLQTFLSMKEMESRVATMEESLQKILISDGMTNTTLSCDIDKIVHQFQAKMPTLGKIEVKSLPSEITIVQQKNKQAQIIVASPPLSCIETITLSLQQTIKTGAVNTRGCVLLPDGRMLFSCYNQNSVTSINKDGSRDFDTGPLSTCTFDIAYIEDTNTIAVTSGGRASQCIKIIDMGSGQVKNTIPVNTYCYGVVYRNNALIYNASGRGLRMVNLDDNSVSDIITSQMQVHGYVATFKDKLYYINNDTNAVTCCDLHGSMQWQFKDERILKYPLGITVDNYGNVYVVGNKSNNVVMISADGQRRRQLLSEQDGLNGPQVLHYEGSTNQLLVANRRGVAFLFHVEKLKKRAALKKHT